MQYNIGNYASQTTAAPVKVTTGTSIKTMLQVAPVFPMRIVEWGCSFDGSTAATPGQVELIETGTVFATVTAHVTAGITRYDAEAVMYGDPATTLLTLGTGATGFTATVEGSITASRNLAGPQLIAPTNQFIEQFPLGYRPVVQSVNGTGYAMRVRVTFGTAVNMYCYVIVEF